MGFPLIFLLQTGKFVRKDSVFREIISKDHPIFKPEKGRYVLYISHACPWAHSVNIVRVMKGLEDVIELSVTHPTWKKTRPDDSEDIHHGWAFSNPTDDPIVPPCGEGAIPCDGCSPDPVFNAAYIRDLYDHAGDTNGKYTVPMLWDKNTSTIVNNESSELIRMFNSAFSEFAEADAPDIYPAELQDEINTINDWIYHNINNGVYKCGFARSQPAYDEAVSALYEHLDRVEDVLSKQTFLCSNENLTEADIRLFRTLVRFDEVYAVYFKCNVRLISSYDNMLNWMRHLYSMPAFKLTTDMAHIKNRKFPSSP